VSSASAIVLLGVTFLYVPTISAIFFILGISTSRINGASLTSSASTSPSLAFSRPTTPASQPLSPYLKLNQPGGQKRLYQNGDDLVEPTEVQTEPLSKLVNGKRARVAKEKLKKGNPLEDRLASILKTSGKLRTTKELVEEMTLKSASMGKKSFSKLQQFIKVTHEKVLRIDQIWT